jgi:feruloyl esterase
MAGIRFAAAFWWVAPVLLLSAQPTTAGGPGPQPSDTEAACRALLKLPDVTVTLAELTAAEGETPEHCYIRGTIAPAIRFHMQLPLPSRWNGRLLNIGDGGKDGDLDYAPERLAQGYAVANSNMGHDAGVEPNSAFAWNNRQAEIDFGYRAVHLTASASKTVVKAYYGREEEYAYFEGCSTGGREGFMEAQRFPYDFDGIVAGAPVFEYQRINMAHVWSLQMLFRDKFAGNLAFDLDGDGVPESLSKLEILQRKVLNKCDGRDGVRDGYVEDPLSCDFDAEYDLADNRCPGDVNADGCFTKRQLQTIKNIYRGPYDSKGTSIIKGLALGSEFSWARRVVPHAGNNLFPSHLGYEVDHVNFLFYEHDPGVRPPDVRDLSYVTDKKRMPPEFAWWEFNIDDVTAGKGDLMMSITDAKDPNLTRFLLTNKGKFLIYHGWADGDVHPEPTVDYYNDVVRTTFKGNMDEARRHVRLFMAPGMDHCGGGPGPDTWDRLAPLVEWVEKGNPPDHLVATHETEGKVENERKICAYPQKAVYVGPAGGQNDPVNWVAKNFTCR